MLYFSIFQLYLIKIDFIIIIMIKLSYPTLRYYLTFFGTITSKKNICDYYKMSSNDLPVYNITEFNTPNSIFYSKFEINKCECVLCTLKLNLNNFIINPEDNTKVLKWSHEKLIEHYQGQELLNKLKTKINIYIYSLIHSCPLPDIYFDVECRLGCHINLFIID